MIIYKSRDELETMDRCNRVVVDILKEVRRQIKPGVSTLDLDRTAEGMCQEAGVRAAFKGYRGFPKSICVSINEEVVHGIPTRERVLRDGDIVGLDFGIKMDGYFGDAAITVPVGGISERASLLIRVTREALHRGIAAAQEGNRLYDISAAIQEHAERNGFNVVREFVGHGIGTSLHEDPQVPNHGTRGTGPVLKKGLVLAIEPMVNAGRPEVTVQSDGWTASTIDGMLSAHFERSIAIMEDGPWILGGGPEVL